MPAAERQLILFVISSLMVAEERITTQFSGRVSAYGTEEEATFLATQQVDEARHMQFYARFQDEVIASPALIHSHVERARAVPGFVEGYSRIHHDETRHIGYGIWFLRETVRANESTAEVVRQTLRDLLPSVAASLSPPQSGSERDFDALGASADDIRAFALGGLTRRLRIIGVPIETL